jgi:hypothetical protein
MTRIVVHIDELALVGLPHSARHGVADHLVSELTRLLSTGDPPTALRAAARIERLALPAPRFDARTPPAKIGRVVATAVHRGLSQRGRS